MDQKKAVLSLQWQTLKSTGVPELDNHHQEFIDKTNALLIAVSEGKQKNVLMDILLFSRKYAKKHFAREEEFMQKHNCPAAEKNKLEHTLFINKFDSIIDDYLKYGETETLATQVVNELNAWIINHIETIDAELTVCVRD
jgi:hemerythrin